MDGFEDEVLGKAYDTRLMRRLIGYVKPYRKLAFLSAIALLLYSALDLAGPLLIREAADGPILDAIEGRISMEEGAAGLAGIGLLFGGTVVLALLARFAHMMMVEYMGQRVMVDIRHRVFEKIQRLSLRHFDRNPVGRLVTRVVSDVEALYQALSSGLVAIFGDLVKIVAIVGILLGLNWQLALWLFSVMPLLGLISVRFRKKARQAYRDVRKEIARTNANLQETITGVRVIQAFGQEEKAKRRFLGLSEALFDSHRRTVVHYALFFAAVEVLFGLAQAVLIWAGATYIVAETLTYGDFILVWFLIGLVFEPIRSLSQQYNVMQGAMASSERIFRLLDREEDVPNPPQPRPLDPATLRGEIVFENVWFAYRGEDWVLKDLSFRVAPGESIALVGATGAGKTSIISLVSRLYDVNRGRITLDGVDIREYDKYELRRQIAVVLQDVFLFAGDVMENIRLAQEEISEERVIQAAEAVHADRFVSRLPDGYRAEVLERGATFSVGQKQLLAFARALAFDPRVLLLAEATSSVDTETEVLIQEALDPLLRGRSSIIIAHRLSTIQRCDRILVMHHGELKEQGTHQELLRRQGIYRRLYELQYGLHRAG